MSYLRFRVLAKLPDAKTHVIAVESAKRDILLGTIKWYGAWRQYTFWPESQTILNHECLREIADRCQAETQEHRRKVMSR